MCPDQNGETLRRYTINDMVRTFGLSRTTIMYYESIGILSPGREGDQARRTYSNADVYRLMSATLLKNVGIAPKDLRSYLDNDPFAREHGKEYLERIERDIEYQQAKLECMRMLGELRCDVGNLRLVEIEPFYIKWDGADVGYGGFPEDESLDLLMANMPIGGLGSMVEPDAAALNVLHGYNHWGRTVPVRFARLIPGLDTSGFHVIGGCTCLRFVSFSTNIHASDEANYSALTHNMDAYMTEHGLERAGSFFSPYSLPSDHGFFSPTCLPVRPKGPR